VLVGVLKLFEPYGLFGIEPGVVVGVPLGNCDPWGLVVLIVVGAAPSGRL
jgi:hypothetical protein